ncbi:secreted RxLR effector protein 161-like [Rhagoletis pomonella]|uniref:secreted RxLR effector protein 161-like n=1 Tax=Rhagoletis pomonella TaxID=28610 RepID=UPI001785363C|nr:secreted RxLR effector protein 161-like [Rhagoletis pomonella]
MDKCKTKAVPLEAGYQTMCDDDCNKADAKQYQSLIGALMHLGLTTRPDILHSVSKLSQRNKNPHIEHMTAAKHILRYLKATLDFKLLYRAGGSCIEGFVDADWGSDPHDRKSYTGFVFFYGKCAISWESRKQTTIALSSTEAEYIAASNAAKEAVYLQRLLNEIGFSKDQPIILHIDNQGAQKLATNPVYHNRTKHIDVRYHHIRELVNDKMITLSYCPTDEMTADIFTKNLPGIKHKKFTTNMNIL